MGSDKYNKPSEGAANWDEPVNQNFTDLGIEVVGEVQSFADLPSPSEPEVSSNGERRKFLVRDSRVVYRDTGSGWEPVFGLGTSSNRVPGTVYTEEHDTTKQTINGHRIYVQSSEPSDASEQDVWIDTS